MLLNASVPNPFSRPAITPINIALLSTIAVVGEKNFPPIAIANDTPTTMIEIQIPGRPENLAMIGQPAKLMAEKIERTTGLFSIKENPLEI